MYGISIKMHWEGIMQDTRCKDPHAWDGRVSRRTYPDEAKPFNLVEFHQIAPGLTVTSSQAGPGRIDRRIFGTGGETRLVETVK